jgi:hypothetical protein
VVPPSTGRTRPSCHSPGSLSVRFATLDIGIRRSLMLSDQMEKDYLILKRASASRPSGEWNDDDFDVLSDGKLSAASSRPMPRPWVRPGCGRSTHGYAATREAAMAASAKSWRRK